MVQECRGEIIRPDGQVAPVERRAPGRSQPTYLRTAGKGENTVAKDRRARRRVPDEILRGRLLDLLG
jgi:hypothetical protein